MDHDRLESDEEISSSSDDSSFCEHGYPLHEEPPTAEKLSDKAVVTIKEGEEEVSDHMFLVPYMRGESPLNDIIKGIVSVPSESTQENMQNFPGGLRNGEMVETMDEGMFLSGSIDERFNTTSTLDCTLQKNDIHDDDKQGIMTAKDAAPIFEKNEPSGEAIQPEHFKFMMEALWSNPVEEKIKQIAEASKGSGINDFNKSESSVGQDSASKGVLDTQVSEYTKLLAQLTSAMDGGLPDCDTEHDDKGQTFTCTLCDWSFSSESDLNNHQRLHSGERPYQCEFCIGNFQDKTALLNHRRQHTGEKPYKCDICDACFSQKHSLVVHKNVHTGEKKYKCELCDASFVCRSNLNVHMRIHTGSKPYTCEFCNSSYSQKSQLTVHKRIHTGEKPFKCQLCPSAFAVRGHLIHHIRVHTGEKPFKCEECGSAFTKRCSLRVHMRTHTGEKPYHCQFCEQAFHLKNMLTKHLLNFHRIAKKLPTPPQKEGDPPPPVLMGLIPQGSAKSQGRLSTVAKTPGPSVTPQPSAKSSNKPSPSTGLRNQNSLGTLKRDSAGATNSVKNTIKTTKDETPTTNQKQRNSKQSVTSNAKLSSPAPAAEPRSASKKNTSSAKNPQQPKSTSKNEKPDSKVNKRNTKSKPKTSSNYRDTSEEENLEKTEANKKESAVSKPKKTKTNNNSNKANPKSLNSESKGKLSSRNKTLSALLCKDKPDTQPTSLGNHSDQGKDTGKFSFPSMSNTGSFELRSSRNTPSSDCRNFPTLGNSSSVPPPTAFSIHSSQNSWSGQATGYQSSPVAQRMAEYFHDTSPAMLNPTVKSNNLEGYPSSLHQAPPPAMNEGYHEYYPGMLGHSQAPNILSQRLSGATGQMGPSFSNGSFP